MKSGSPLIGLSAGCGFRKETIAGIRGNERDAPTAVVRGTAIGPPESTLSGPLAKGHETRISCNTPFSRMGLMWLKRFPSRRRTYYIWEVFRGSLTEGAPFHTCRCGHSPEQGLRPNQTADQ